MHVSDSMVLAVLLLFFKTQLLSNGLVNMTLLAYHKLEHTDKATVTYCMILSFIGSIRAPFYRAYSLLLSSLSVSFSLVNVGFDILVLGPFVPNSQSLVIWFEHAQIIGKEAWSSHNRKHFAHTLSQPNWTHGQTNFRQTIKCGARSCLHPII